MSIVLKNTQSSSVSISSLSIFYYIAKLAVRVAMLVKKEYVITPDVKKGTLMPVLHKIWKEYNFWVTSHKLWRILGYFYLWLIITYLLILLAYY